MGSKKSQKGQDSPQKDSPIKEEPNEQIEQQQNDPNQESLKDEEQRPNGIYKLFDLMRTDLGQQQADEMRQFYEKMSSQIKEICQDRSSNSGGETSKGCQNSRSNIDSDGQIQSQSITNNDAVSLKQSLLMSLLQFQSKQLLVSQTDQQTGGQDRQDDDEESKREVQSSSKGGPETTGGEQSQKAQIEEADVSSLFSDNQKVQIFLKPGKKRISNYLREKSQNNIDPRVVIETRAGKLLNELMGEIAEKLFKENPTSLILKIGEQIFSHRSKKEIKVRDLMLADENVLGESLRQAEEKSVKVQEFEDLKLKAVYSLQLSDEASDLRNHFKTQKKREKIEIPEDLTETELMEMLTEVMSIMLINREEKMNQAGKMGGLQSTIASFDPKAKLVSPNVLSSKRRKKSKTGDIEDQWKHQGTEQYKNNQNFDEEGETLNASQKSDAEDSQENLREAKTKLQPHRKSLNERMQEYQQQLKRREAKESEKYAQRVQKLFQKEQKKVKDRINAWYNGEKPFNGEQQNEQLNNTSQFTSTIDKINFKANPFFSSLIKLT